MPFVKVTVPAVLSSPASRSKPVTITPALHRITPSQSTVAVGQEITSIPTDVGNSITVVNPPVMRAAPFTYGAFRGTANSEDDSVRLASSPAVSLAEFTTLVVARLKNVALGSGNTSIFYMMPPGGGRNDLTLLAPSGTRVLRFTSGTSANQVNHGWTPDTNWHIFSVTQGPGSVAVGVDGVEATANFTPETSNGFSLGTNRGGGFANVDVADAIIFPYLTPAQRLAEVQNLAAFYGITLP